MSVLRMFTVDAFTDKRFLGNPAAVCLDVDNEPLPEEVKQKIACEMNLSETAYVRPVQAGDLLDNGSRFSLRWFTPVTEVLMCGHATLATAFVLFHKLKNPSPALTFETLSGDLIVRKDNSFLEMDFPTGFTEQENITEHESLIQTLLGDSDKVEEIVYCKPIKYLLINLKEGWTREEFESWKPPVASLPGAEKTGKVLLVIVTVKGSPDNGYVDKDGQPYDFVSRVFAPWTGVPEDPVTGSAHTVLAHYWSERLGKTEFYAKQCSARGGHVWVTRRGERTLLRGQATLVMESQLFI